MADRSLQIDLIVNDQGATDSIARFNTELTKSKTIAQQASEADARLEAKFKDVDKTGKDLDKTLDRLQKSHKANADATKQGTTATEQFGGMVQKFLVGGAIVLAIKNTLALADEMSNLAARTGMAVEPLQRLDYAARQYGSSASQIALAMQTMADRIGGGDKSAVAALNRMGMSVQSFLAMSPEQQFVAVATGLQRVGDAAQQADAGNALFGRGFKQLAGVFKADIAEMTNGADKFGQVMSEKTVDTLDSLGDELGNAGRAGKAFLGDFIAPTIPALTTLAKVVQTAAANYANLGRELEAAGKRSPYSLYPGSEMPRPDLPPEYGIPKTKPLGAKGVDEWMLNPDSAGYRALNAGIEGIRLPSSPLPGLENGAFLNPGSLAASPGISAANQAAMQAEEDFIQNMADELANFNAQIEETTPKLAEVPPAIQATSAAIAEAQPMVFTLANGFDRLGQSAQAAAEKATFSWADAYRKAGFVVYDPVFARDTTPLAQKSWAERTKGLGGMADGGGGGHNVSINVDARSAQFQDDAALDRLVEKMSQRFAAQLRAYTP